MAESTGGNKAFLGVGTVGGTLGTYSNIPLFFYTNNTARLRLSSSGGLSVGYTTTDAPALGGMIVQGSVGIGTTSPTHKFSVVNGGVNVTTTSNTANFRIEEAGDVIIGI
jgi:hypothetical protein